MGKIQTLDSLSKICEKFRDAGKIIVTTNGVFDILHPGHVRYLENAKALGDILVVGVNSDASVKKIKGEHRPVNSEDDRAEVLAALQCIDYVCVFPETTPEHFLEAIKPSVHVKGGDYSSKDLPESAIVEKFGGKIKFVTFVKGYSTTTTIKKIVERHKA
ncbi:MAG: D-glycero-beta-D-manno-heptose 1-phosphate adenylyltransferase [Candidatus Micrarchaeota archaeon]